MATQDYVVWLSEHGGEGRFVAVEHGVEAVAVAELERDAGHGRRVGLEHERQGLLEVLGMVRIDQFAPGVLGEEFLVGADVAGEGGEAGGHGFEHGVGHAFFAAGGHGEAGVGEKPGLEGLFDVAGEMDEVCEVLALALRFEGGAFRAGPGDDVGGAVLAKERGIGSQGVEREGVLFDRVEAGEVEYEGGLEQRAVGRRGRRGQVVTCGVEAGVEGLEIDPVGDHVHGGELIAGQIGHGFDALCQPVADDHKAVCTAVALGDGVSDAGFFERMKLGVQVAAAGGDDDGESGPEFGMDGGVAGGVGIEREDHVEGGIAGESDERTGDDLGPAVLGGGTAVADHAVGGGLVEVSICCRGWAALREDGELVASGGEALSEGVGHAFGAAGLGHEIGSEKTDTHKRASRGEEPTGRLGKLADRSLGVPQRDAFADESPAFFDHVPGEAGAEGGQQKVLGHGEAGGLEVAFEFRAVPLADVFGFGALGVVGSATDIALGGGNDHGGLWRGVRFEKGQKHVGVEQVFDDIDAEDEVKEAEVGGVGLFKVGGDEADWGAGGVELSGLVDAGGLIDADDFG